ncbi:MAG: mreC [Paucimonas sp.]|jgi:rod shape-determining protein MreC|nr:mreC [Paucimonas sp.]
MDYSPPPLFKQGASARAKVSLFAILSIGLLFVDSHINALAAVRQVVGTVLYPFQVAAMWPRDAAYAVGGYFTSLSSTQRENLTLKQQRVLDGQVLQQAQQLQAENAQLRKLLGASEQLPAKTALAEILYDTRDPFTRKIVLNRGSQHGVAPGQPVIDDVGVVGQVTRVFPFTSEVTLLTDKDQAIPVQVVRSGLRSVAYGKGQAGTLELRFMPLNADIKQGDVLVTSGIDGVYPPGLQVAKVAQAEHKSSDTFARIVCQPSAGIDRNRQLLILLVDTALPLRPGTVEPAAKDKKEAAAKPSAPEAGAVPQAAPASPGETPKASAPATAKSVAPAAPGAVSAPASAGAASPLPNAAAPGAKSGTDAQAEKASSASVASRPPVSGPSVPTPNPVAVHTTPATNSGAAAKPSGTGATANPLQAVPATPKPAANAQPSGAGTQVPATIAKPPSARAVTPATPETMPAVNTAVQPAR